MTAFNPELFLSTLALIGVVIILSALLSGFVEKSGLPQVAVFLSLGAVIGPAGLSLVNVDLHSPILRVVGTLSLVLVLFTDAVSLNLTEVRKHARLSLSIVGPGALVLALLIATAAFWLFGLPPGLALILGAALASTDPVMLRALLGKPEVNSGVRQALRLEGGMNDAVLLPVVLVGMTILEGGHSPSIGQWRHLAMNILILSPAAGIIVGLASLGMLETVRKKIGVRRDYESIYSLGIAFAAFAAAESLHGSGFLAAFAAGLTISALDVELCDCFLEYGETTAEMALMFTFVLFGMSVIWSGLTVIGISTLIFTVIVFAARPIAFIPALLPSKLSWKNRGIIAWFGPKGLSSLLLVLLPVFDGLPGSEKLIPICCLVVLFSVVLHGLSPAFLVRPSMEKIVTADLEQPPPALPEAPATEPFCALKFKKNQTQELMAEPVDSEFITVAEVKQLQVQSADVLVVDARREKSFDESEERIPGAVRVHPQFAARSATELDLPKATILAVLCNCPDEATSDRVAKELRKAGWSKARALRGGWAAWHHEPELVQQVTT